MFKSIPMGSIVSIIPSALGGGGNPLALNGALIVKGLLDNSATVREVTHFDDFKKIFQKEDLDAVNSYFNSVTIATKLPEKLFVTVKRDSDYGAVLSSARLSPWQANKGSALSMDLVVDGVRKEVKDVDYDGLGSYSNIAAEIGSQLTLNVKFDEASQKFIIESPTTGLQSIITTANGELAEALSLTDISGAYAVNGGVADESITDAMDRIFNYTQNWGGITTSYALDLTEGEAFAKWINNQGNRFWGVIWTIDPKAYQNAESIGTLVKERQFSGISCIYGDAKYATTALGFMASLDFSALKGRMTADFRTQQGLPAAVEDAATANMLERNGYMYYGAYATANDRFTFFRNSVVSGQFKWVDTYLNQVYFNSQLQLAMFTMLYQNKAVPYNAEGAAMHYAAAKDPIDEMKNFGGIVEGIQLSSNQAMTVNREAGTDAASQIYTKGWFLRVGDATAQVREARASRPLHLWYSDGGSTHSINMASTAII